MPSDIIGTEILEEDHGTGHRHFRFQRGPVFTNLLLADEINRTPPKTQAALLEAMQERTVSYAGVTHRCRRRSSCWPRRTRSSRPAPIRCPKRSSTASCCTSASTTRARAKSATILAQTTGTHACAKSPHVMHGEEVLALQSRVREVHLGDDLLAWITRLVRASRPQDERARRSAQVGELGRRSARRAVAGAGGEGARAAARPPGRDARGHRWRWPRRCCAIACCCRSPPKPNRRAPTT